MPIIKQPAILTKNVAKGKAAAKNLPVITEVMYRRTEPVAPPMAIKIKFFIIRKVILSNAILIKIVCPKVLS